MKITIENIINKNLKEIFYYLKEDNFLNLIGYSIIRIRNRKEQISSWRSESNDNNILESDIIFIKKQKIKNKLSQKTKIYYG